MCRNGKPRILTRDGVRLLMTGMVLTFGLAAWSAAQGADEAVMRNGDVSYVSGGVGDESMQRMSGLAGEFNLQLLCVANAGNYLSDVAVSIRDARGTVVLDAKTDGPLLLARLPAGRYQVVAALDGVTQRQTIMVSAGTQRKLVLRWNVPVD